MSGGQAIPYKVGAGTPPRSVRVIVSTAFRPRVRACARGTREQRVYEPRLEAAL